MNKETQNAVGWYLIGAGRRLHAMIAGDCYTVCGIGGPCAGPFAKAGDEIKCKECMRLTANAESEALT